MAFFSGLSSSIGKRLLLYGLRQIDIFDKDPADFVSVDVGKRTTLEVRDVGLHIKKLVALLHLDLPPELHLSKARASLLRVTLVFDFGVPQISIQIDGIQVQARIQDVENDSVNPLHVHPSATSSVPRDDGSDVSDSDEHVPTVDELAKSFMRAEPNEEIRELEQELEAHPEYMDDSLAYGSDGDEDGSAGMGAPLALPTYLRNILNTALDRLSLAVNDIDIEVEDCSNKEEVDSTSPVSSSPVSLHFHVESIAIDSIAASDTYSDPASESDVRKGKRRMRIEQVCARIVSDVDNFVSMSKVSRPASPSITRSSPPIARSEPHESHSSIRDSHAHQPRPQTPDEVSQDQEDAEHKEAIVPASGQASLASLPNDDIPSPSSSVPGSMKLAESNYTVDEDRFADAATEDEIPDYTTDVSPPAAIHQQRQYTQLSTSDLLYDDDEGGVLEYALDNGLLDSRFEDDPEVGLLMEQERSWSSEQQNPTVQDQHYLDDSEMLTSNLPTVSALGRSFPQHRPQSQSTSMSDLPTVSALGRSFAPPASVSSSLQASNFNPLLSASTSSLAISEHDAPLEQATAYQKDTTPPQVTPEVETSPAVDDLAESQLFSHDEAESMYMSALSAAPHVPGGWDSSSSSSKSYALGDSASIPDDMIAGSVLNPVVPDEESCQTPRPGTPQSAFASPLADRASTPTAAAGTSRQSKLFLSIDEVTIWFPLGLEQQQPEQDPVNVDVEGSAFDFDPPKLGEDSIFAEMPGSFSNYALSSSHRRKPSMESSVRRQAQTRAQGHADRDRKDSPISQGRQPRSSAITMDVGSIAGHMDVSSGRIMYTLLNRVLSAFTGTPTNSEKSPKAELSIDNGTKHIEVIIKEVGIAWLEQILAESLLGGQSASRALPLNPSGAILRIGLGNLRLSSRIRAVDSKAKLQIGTFVLASLDQDIVSFKGAKPSSKRATYPGTEHLSHDIEIDYEQGDDQRITIVTRPVVVLFDLQKLDEALSSFGGFSGVLELSSSMSSANTVSSPVASTSQARPRGVHFGDAPKTTGQTVSARTKSPKIQVQLGEVAFILKGRSCAVQLQTTSVRVAVRGGNVRLKVTEVKLEGPFTSQDQKGAPLLVDIKGTTLNFLFAPEESDLAKLISMITPSKDPYENNEDILIDTLLRQRRKGSVLRLEVVGVGVRVFNLEELKAFESLGAEIARLSKVTKYLPDDDRPGLLTLASVQQVDAGFAINDRLGDISIALQNASAAHVGVPALLALEIGQATVKRGKEVLLHELTKLRPQDQLPAIMVRMVGDEMEPIVKAKLFNVCAEYHVSTVMAALGLSDDGTGDDIALGIAASVATITGATSPKSLSRQSSQTSSPSESHRKPLQVDLLLRDCAIGLNPRKLLSKALFVFADAHLGGHQAKQDYSITLELRKASILVVDDVANLDDAIKRPRASTTATTHRHTLDLQDDGYCLLSSISAAYVYVNIIVNKEEDTQRMDVELKNELFVLESCADSTQTLIAIINGLQPPTPPSTAERYRPTIPLQQMMESFTGDALLADEPEEEDFMDNADLVEDEVPTNLEFVGSIYNSQSLPTNEELGDSMLGEDDLGAFADSGNIRSIGDRGMLESFQEHYEVADDEVKFEFNDNFFLETAADLQGKARKWDSAKNQYHLTNEFKTTEAPIKLRVRDVNIIWNLYDGYDWQRTRDVISQAVDDVEARAEERRMRAHEEDEDDDFIEEDFLFNSVWIGVPVKDEKGALARRINHDIDDLVSETGSYATSTATRTTIATGRPGSATKSKRRLKLKRSKHKKIAFSLMGIAVDAVVFTPDSGETINSLDVRVRDFEIFDHVPTSTWKKFVTCLIEPNARQVTKPMIELEVVTVKPVTDLAASELVVKVTVLPLRLHVDQDALDFITRFFEFKDDTQPVSTAPSEQPFIQRLEVNSVVLKLDYKPKRVDYRGLRSGHTTEFMNFLILDGSDIVLRHAIVYGLTSFDKVHKTLNDVWMPDVQRNQLPGVLSGLAAVRPLVNVGSGVRDLVVVPMREYRKDGRVVRSLQKGVYAFAKNTTSEVARLGAKVAIGTQNLLEGAETFLAPQTGMSPRNAHSDWDGEDPSGSPPEETRAVSHYANQPLGVKAGLRSAARHLERDLLTARDAVIAIPAEVMEQGSGVGVAKALARHAPTVILRPALGATKALSNALLGVGNALDGDSRRKVEDKYKSY